MFVDEVRWLHPVGLSEALDTDLPLLMGGDGDCTDTLFWCATSMAGKTANCGPNAIGASGTGAHLVRAAAIPIEGQFWVSKIGWIDVAGSVHADLFLDKPAEGYWWVGQVIFQDFEGSAKNGG